ncbi:MAG: ATP-binding protein [Gemmatimonadetes bacterium]|nr:ATP-binding protein [Gemmatimonadota bacterium]
MTSTALIPRNRHLSRVRALLGSHPVVALLGARQVGKPTLARSVAEGWGQPVTRFDLQDPASLARLSDPMLALADLRGLVVLDEIQRRPDLFPALRVLVDRPGSETRFLILGSASPELLRQSSETLAGRIVYHELEGFRLDETGAASARRLWIRGGFPRSFLASTAQDSYDWRVSFVRTFLERDIPQLGVRIPATTLHRFWMMVAHYHAQRWNGAELARAFGVSESAVRRYLDLLTDALVLRQLPAWHQNVGKRQVKSPKVYLADSGILHALLGLETKQDVEGHPKIGASWEGFVIAEVTRVLGARPDELFFWATHAGAELDLLFIRGGRRIGFEIKRTTAPTAPRSMRAALETLGLDRLDLIHAGAETLPLGDGVRAVAFSRIEEDLTRAS